MGFFSWIADRVSSVIDWVKDKLGGSSYSGSTVQERVDVEEVLSEFKEDLGKKAHELEEKCIDKAKKEFQEFSDKFKRQYPSSSEELDKRRRILLSELKGTITDYAQSHISENDPEFQKTLKMRPGKEKKETLENEINSIVISAEGTFYQKLQQAMGELHDEFERRLMADLKQKEDALEKQTKKYEDLEKEMEGTEESTVKLEAHENRQRVLEEVDACLDTILSEEEPDK